MDPPFDRERCGCDNLLRILVRFFASAGPEFNEGSAKNYCRKGVMVPCPQLIMFYKPTIHRPSALLKSPTTGEYQLKCKIHLEALHLFYEWYFNQAEDREGYPTAKEFFKLLQSEIDVGNPERIVPFIERMSLDSAGNADLYLSLSRMRYKILRCTLRKTWTWNHDEESIVCDNNYRHKVKIVMSKDTAENPESCWLKYRKIIVAQAITRILNLTGHQIEETNFSSICSDGDRVDENTVFVIGKEFRVIAGILKTLQLKQPAAVESLLRPETVIKTIVGSITAKSDSLSSLINERLNIIIQSKEATANPFLSVPEKSPAWISSASNLALASLHYELLSKPLESDIHLRSLETKGNDGLFIMYNYARIMSILQKFQERVDRSEYPKEYANVKEDDHKLMTKEEAQIYQLLLEWPRLVNCGINFARAELNFQIIPKFLLALAQAFNDFYFSVNVLVPANAPHNFPMMKYRIQLIQGIRYVYEDCLEIMQLTPNNN